MTDETSAAVSGTSGRARVVFMGTPDFAVPTLERLLDACDILAVFTKPDRPAGRGRTPRQSPIKKVALAHSVPVFQPTSLRRDLDAVAVLRDLSPDVVVVAAYGLFLPSEVLGLAPGGAVNVHASLLPRWRGASPVSHAMLAGDDRTGATIMLMDDGWDTGPILAQRATDIGETETAGEVTDRLAALGAGLLIETLPGWLSGAISAQPQDDGQATLAPRLSRDDAVLDWGSAAPDLARRVRALHPWPGAFTTLPDGDRLKVHSATAIGEDGGGNGDGDGSRDGGGNGDHDATASGEPGAPGTVLPGHNALVVATGDGFVRLDEVQAAGRRRVSGADFVRGRPDVVGTVLSSGEPAE